MFTSKKADFISKNLKKKKFRKTLIFFEVWILFIMITKPKKSQKYNFISYIFWSKWNCEIN